MFKPVFSHYKWILIQKLQFLNFVNDGSPVAKNSFTLVWYWSGVVLLYFYKFLFHMLHFQTRWKQKKTKKCKLDLSPLKIIFVLLFASFPTSTLTLGGILCIAIAKWIHWFYIFSSFSLSSSHFIGEHTALFFCFKCENLRRSIKRAICNKSA